MGKILLFMIMAATILAAIVRPWIGVLAVYLFVLLNPTTIWPWVFDDVRPVLWITVPTLFGFSLALLTNRVHLRQLNTRNNVFFAIWWLFAVVSYTFGPYVNQLSEWRFNHPDVIFEIMNKALLFYFVAAICIDDDRKFRYLFYVMVGAILYLIFWANAQYLQGNILGRLTGPGHMDENGFAILFVVGLPFLYYLSLYHSNKIIRYGLWLVIPFGWHAVFLTGSRGGLLGLGVSILLMSLRSSKKLFTVFLIPVFLVAYVWQAGSIMKERARDIPRYEEVASSQTRLQAWAAAGRMILSHPVTGVGVSSFGAAFSNFSDKHPREAHNTFLQISAEMGLMAGIAWLGIVIFSLLGLWRSASVLRSRTSDEDRFAYYASESVLVSLIGFVTCSTFLSLHTNELFFYLAILANYLLLRYRAEKRRFEVGFRGLERPTEKSQVKPTRDSPV